MHVLFNIIVDMLVWFPSLTQKSSFGLSAEQGMNVAGLGLMDTDIHVVFYSISAN